MKSFYTEAKNHLSNCTRIISSSTSEVSSSLPANHHHKHELDNDYDYETDVTSTEVAIAHGGGHHMHEDEDDETFPPNTSPTLGLNNNFITTTAITSTYDTLQRPFKYDKLRGRWSTAADFYFACTSHAFGSIIFSELALYVSMFAGGKLVFSVVIVITLKKKMCK